MSDSDSDSSFNSVQSISEHFDDPENEVTTIDVLLLGHKKEEEHSIKMINTFAAYGLYNACSYQSLIEGADPVVLEDLLGRTSYIIILLDQLLVENKDFLLQLMESLYAITTIRYYFVFVEKSKRVQKDLENTLASSFEIMLDDENTFILPIDEPFFSDVIYDLVSKVDPKLLSLVKVVSLPTNDTKHMPGIDHQIEKNATYDGYFNNINEILDLKGKVVQFESSKSIRLLLIKYFIQELRSNERDYVYFQFDNNMMNTTYMLLFVLNFIKDKFKLNRKVSYCLAEGLEDTLAASKNNIILCRLISQLMDKLNSKFIIILDNLEVINSPEILSLRQCVDELSKDLVFVIYSSDNYSGLFEDIEINTIDGENIIETKGSLLTKLESCCTDAVLIKLLNILKSPEYLNLQAVKEAIDDESSFNNITSVLEQFCIVESRSFKLDTSFLPKLPISFQADYCTALFSKRDTFVQAIQYIFHSVKDEAFLAQLFNSFTFLFTLWQNIDTLGTSFRNFIKTLYFSSNVSIQFVDYCYSLYKLIICSAGSGFMAPAKILSVFLYIVNSMSLSQTFPIFTYSSGEENKGYSSLIILAEQLIFNDNHKLTYFNPEMNILREEQEEDYKYYHVKFNEQSVFKIKLDPGYSPTISLNDEEIGTFFIEMGSTLNLHQLTYIEKKHLFVFRSCSTFYVYDLSNILKKSVKPQFAPRNPVEKSTFEIRYKTFINSSYTGKNFFGYTIDSMGVLTYIDIQGQPLESVYLEELLLGYDVQLATSGYFEFQENKIIVIGLTNGNLSVFDLISSKILFTVKAHEGSITKISLIEVLDSPIIVTGSVDTTISFYSIVQAKIVKVICFSKFVIRDFVTKVIDEVVWVFVVDGCGTLFTSFLFDFELDLIENQPNLSSAQYWQKNASRRKFTSRSSALPSKFKKDVESIFPSLHHRPNNITLLLGQQLVKYGNVQLLFGKTIKKRRRSSITFDRKLKTNLLRKKNSSRNKFQELSMLGFKQGSDLQTVLTRSQQLSCVAIRRDGAFFAFSPMNSKLLVYSFEFKRYIDINKRTLNLKNIENSKKNEYIGHESTVTVLVFSRDSKLLATGCEKGLVCLWDCTQNFALVSKYSHATSISSLAFDSLTSYLASGSHDHIIKVWTLKSPSNLMLREDAIEQFKQGLPGRQKRNPSAARRRDRESFGRRPNRVSARRNYKRRTKEIDFRKNKKRHKRVSAMSRAVQQPEAKKSSLQLREDEMNTRINHMTCADAIIFGPLKECLVFFDNHGPPSSISFNSRLNLLASCCTSHYGALKVWQLDHHDRDFAQILETVDNPALGEQFPKVVFFSDDCKYMVCGCEQTTKVESSHLVVLYEIRYVKGKLAFRRARALYISGFPNYVYLGLSLDNNYLAEASAGSNVRYWHIKSNKEVKPEIYDDQARRKDSVLSFSSNVRSRLMRSSIRESRASLDTNATKTVETFNVNNTKFQFHQQSSADLSLQSYPSWNAIEENSVVCLAGDDSLNSIKFPNECASQDTSYILETPNRDYTIVVRGATVNTFEN